MQWLENSSSNDVLSSPVGFIFGPVSSVPRCFSNLDVTCKISDSFEMLNDIALKDLTVNLGSSRLQDLTEFALHVENNRESDQKLCIGKCLFRQY